MKGTLLISHESVCSMSGSVSTISKKLGYGTCSTSLWWGLQHGRGCPGFTPNGHQFRKPRSFSLVMFTGEAMCLFLFFYRRAQAAARSKRRDESLLPSAAA